jgi:DNA-binding transcriptional ArsR family regulator
VAEGGDPRVALLRELADPLRLGVVDRLGHGGPATVSELADGLGVALPKLSNHLRRLREAGLVTVERTGRHAVYALADPGVEALLPVLDRLTHRAAPPSAAPAATPFARARTCYDHLAGALGVSVYAALRARDAVRDRPDGTVEVGPAGPDVFGALGVDVDAVADERRRFAFECFDATEHAPHLAGALGGALAAALAERRWTEPGRDRVVSVTDRGARGLRRALGVGESLI